MRLLKFHIIGHPDFARGSWIDVGEGINILAPARTTQAQTLLQVLQAIHPPYDCQRVHPFASFPLYRSANAVTRKIILAKRTAVIAIYAAPSSLVEKLAAIEPLYWEVDRIEIGRRRDYSRWLNFVEIPASARWSDIAKILQPLLASLSAEEAKKFGVLSHALESLSGKERLKGERVTWFRAQIRQLHPLLSTPLQVELARCLGILALNEHFQRAKDLVFANLPLFLSLPSADSPLTIHGQLDFLAQRLVECIPDKTALSAQIEAINCQWREVGAHLTLLPVGESLRVAVDSSRPLQERERAINTREYTTRMLHCAAILHQAIYGRDPILLVDFKRYCEIGHRCENPIAQLRQLCGQFQCLVAPDEHLRDLCSQSERARLLQSDYMHIVTI